MEKNLKPYERLYVAVDFRYGKGRHLTAIREDLRHQALTLAEVLAKTKVGLKFNSVLRACGYSLIEQVGQMGLRVFADLKLVDTHETLANDGDSLALYDPDFVTASWVAGPNALRKLAGSLFEGSVLGVGLLSTQTENDAQEIYGCSIQEVMLKLARTCCESGLGGVICSPAEAYLMKSNLNPGMVVAVTGVRPKGTEVKGDDQNPLRTMTPGEALDERADYLIVGRPVTQSPKPYDAVMRILDEIRD